MSQFNQVNPYAAPQVANPFADKVPSPVSSTYAGLWRDGNVLVMHKLAPLPNICVKSNLPATRRLKRKLTWHSPLVFLALLVNLIVYAIIAMMTSKKATIDIPLTDEWFARRQRRMLIAWAMVGLGLLLTVVGITLVDQFDPAPAFIILGIVMMLAAAITGLISCRLVSPKRITDTHVWLKGVHPDYLDRLEPWPYNV